MATSTVPFRPAAGRAKVVLTSWAGTATFATTPVATDQIEGPDTLTLNADGTVTGADGTYTLRHIQAANGTAEAVNFTIGAVAQVPQGTVTLGTATVDKNSISLPFTYDLSDQTGFEYRLDGGAWTATTSPVVLTGLTHTTEYTVEVRAVNATGGGTAATVAITTDSTATATVPFVVEPTYTLATLEAGFDTYAFQQWPVNEPDVGWQLVTITAEGYFDSQGNYFFDSGTEAIHNVWVIEPDGTLTVETIDNTGLLTPLEGEITIGTVTVGRNSANIEFSYSAADADSFEYRVDNGAWITVVSPIALTGLTAATPYKVDLRAVSGTTQSVFKTVNFTTDAAVDTTPSAFTFAPQTNVARGVTVTSNTITVQGVDAGVDVVSSVTGDTGSQQSVSTDGGATFGGWTTASTNVRLNYRIRVRHTTSASNDTGTTTTLNVGSKSSDFVSITVAAAGAGIDRSIIARSIRSETAARSAPVSESIASNI